MLFDAVNFVTRAFHRHEHGVGVVEAFAGETEFARRHAAIGEQILVARRKRPAITAVMMQMPLERREVAGAIIVAAPGHRRAGQRVELDPQRGFAGVCRRGVEAVAVNVLDDLADFFDEKFIFHDFARRGFDGLADFAGEQRVAARHCAGQADLAFHRRRDADFVGEFFRLGVNRGHLFVQFLVDLETVFVRHKLFYLRANLILLPSLIFSCEPVLRSATPMMMLM